MISELALATKKKKALTFDPRKTKAHLAYEIDDFKLLEDNLIENNHPEQRQTQIPGMARIEAKEPF